MYRLLFLGTAAAACAAAVALLASPHAGAITCYGPVAPTSYSTISPDCGGGDTDPVLDGYEEDDTGTAAGSPDMFNYSSDYAAGRCRIAWARRTRKNYVGVVMWRYWEQIRWCWNGLVVTYFYRDRWASDLFIPWEFKGHVGSNCIYEHCYPGRTGHSSEYAWTQGSFQACVVKIGICTNKLPIVSITVYANGTHTYSTSG